MLKLREEEQPRKASKEWQVGGEAQKVTAREPLVTWPGVADYAEAPGTGDRNGDHPCQSWASSFPSSGTTPFFLRQSCSSGGLCPLEISSLKTQSKNRLFIFRNAWVIINMLWRYFSFNNKKILPEPQVYSDSLFLKPLAFVP